MTESNIGRYATGTSRSVCLAFVLVIAGSIYPPGVVEAAADRVVEITPDDAHQVALTGLYSAPDKATFNRQVDQLIELRADDEQQLIPQLLWFAARHYQDIRTKAFVGRVIARLAAPNDVIVAALAPHLDNRDDVIRGMVKDLLKGFEDRSVTRPPDFSAYRALIEADVRAGREPQASLVHLMYESDPGTALQTMVRAFQLRAPDEIKPILWSEHVVAELFWKRRYGFVERSAVDPTVVRELEKLSRHPQWWVRLYTAEIVKAHPELGVPEVVKRLTEDTDIRVREVLRHAVPEAARESEKK